MEKENMNNAAKNDSRTIKLDNEDEEYNSVKKNPDTPEWNEDLQKIVVGYH